jgi:hypothetical protein
MTHSRFIATLCVLLLLAATFAVATSTTYVVGSCLPSLPSYHSISDALAAVPPPVTIRVCPGTYNEQVEITYGVTLAGISSGNSGQAIIAPPAGGLVVNATVENGSAAAAQVWVNGASGPVNISDLTIDATGNGNPTAFIIGVLYQNSAGTVNHITTRYQNTNTGGIGIWLEGGASNPSVTIENSSIHDFDYLGIAAETAHTATPELTATIKNNTVVSNVLFIDGISLGAGESCTVSGNLVMGMTVGIQSVEGSSGSISNNTITNISNGFGIEVSGAQSVTSNRLYGVAQAGIALGANSGPVTENIITNSPVGIDMGCAQGLNVHSNTLIDTVTGLNGVANGTQSVNSYYNVGTIANTNCL